MQGESNLPVIANDKLVDARESISVLDCSKTVDTLLWLCKLSATLMDTPWTFCSGGTCGKCLIQLFGSTAGAVWVERGTMDSWGLVMLSSVCLVWWASLCVFLSLPCLCVKDRSLLLHTSALVSGVNAVPVVNVVIVLDPELSSAGLVWLLDSNFVCQFCPLWNKALVALLTSLAFTSCDLVTWLGCDSFLCKGEYQVHLESLNNKLLQKSNQCAGHFFFFQEPSGNSYKFDRRTEVCTEGFGTGSKISGTTYNRAGGKDNNWDFGPFYSCYASLNRVCFPKPNEPNRRSGQTFLQVCVRIWDGFSAEMPASQSWKPDTGPGSSSFKFMQFAGS